MKTVIILGTGATIGSGYQRCGEQLPGDRGFFEGGVVREFLPRCYALKLMLAPFIRVYGGGLIGVSLEDVWTYLDFSAQVPYKAPGNLLTMEREWLTEIRQPQAIAADEHAQTRHFRANHSIPPPNIDLHLLAGWDLRLLLNHVYCDLKEPAANVYEQLLTTYKIARDATTTFVSLNYDVVLELALNSAKVCWHYPHVQTDTPRDPDSARIIKPHGSLNWRCRGNQSGVEIATDCRMEPVPLVSREENDFEEPMIIAPTQLKRPLLSPDTQAPATRQLFSNLTSSISGALKDAERIFIIGYSFPPTDHHLRTLFLQNLQARGGAPYRQVYCCTRAADGAEGTVFGNASRYFPAESFVPDDRGFAEFAAAGIGRGA